MSTNQELMGAEESLKNKYLDIVKAMSYLELKKFNKNHFKQMVLNDMMALLPEHEKSQLSQTAHYVSNALNNEAQSQLRRKTRETTSVQKTGINLLSETVLDDLETTMRSECTVTSPDTDVDETDVDDDGDDDFDGQDSVDYENDHHSSTSSAETTQTLNDSITQVKKVAAIETGAASDFSIENDKSSKCCDTCKVKSRSKKQYDMIRCSLCMVWYHEQCVGIQKDEPVGIWLCTSCRKVPHTVQGDIECIRNDVKQLRQSTELILTAVQGLTTKLDNCVGNINDRLTALSRQISCNDSSMTESIETLNASTNSLKSNFDQKTCQILNKTTAVLEKVKSRSDSVKTTILPSKRASDSERIHSASNKPDQSPAPKERSHKVVQPTKQVMKTTNRQVNANIKSSGLTNLKQQQNQSKQHTLQNVDTGDENELIDLTKTPKPNKFINRSTLLVGSSILKGVKVSELKSNVAVRSFPGATIETLRRKLLEFNIDRCKTIIIHVGGNDADCGSDLDTFSDDYFSLLNSLSSSGRRLIDSGLLPRETVNLEPYNQKLKSLCEDYDTEFVDHYQGFLLGTGEMLDSCFQRDMIHVTSAGTKKLLNNIDNIYQISEHVPSTRRTSIVKGFSQNSWRNSVASRNRGYNSSTKFCHICSRNGHSTQECWFNGRNKGTDGYGSR